MQRARVRSYKATRALFPNKRFPQLPDDVRADLSYDQQYLHDIYKHKVIMMGQILSWPKDFVHPGKTVYILVKNYQKVKNKKIN